MLIRKQKMEIYTNTLYFDSSTNQENHYVFKEGLKIGFTLHNNALQSYINSIAFNFHKESNTVERAIIEVEPCNLTTFAGTNFNTSSTEIFSCIKYPEDVFLQGIQLSNNYTDFEIIYGFMN